jgi:hypothetical protein
LLFSALRAPPFFGASWVFLARLLAVTLLTAPSLVRADVSAQIPPGYLLDQVIRLTDEQDGLDGRIELLEDERLTDEVMALVLATFACWSERSSMKGDALAFCESADDTPLRPATVRLVSARGDVLDSRSFERDTAVLGVRSLYGARAPAFSVTVDFTAGMGSYNGPITWFFDLHERKLRWLQARDSEDGELHEMALMSSLKTRWELAPAEGGASLDVVSIACRPDFERKEPDGSVRFLEHRTRYHFDGKAWTRYRRSRPGYWENDSYYAFPKLREFPGPGSRGGR